MSDKHSLIQWIWAPSNKQEPKQAANEPDLRQSIDSSKSAARVKPNTITEPRTSNRQIEAKEQVDSKPSNEPVIDPSTQIVADPFASQQTNPAQAKQSPSSIEKWRTEAGKTYKQVEGEQPIKRWLMGKKDLTPMEKFARDALGATPAREIQTAEEMRPDGSRMTRVKTPRGEFCVVGQPPGRPYEARMPDQRIMQCPIYF